VSETWSSASSSKIESLMSDDWKVWPISLSQSVASAHWPCSGPVSALKPPLKMKLQLSKTYELQPDPFDCTQKEHFRFCLFKDVSNSSRICELLRCGEIEAAIIKAELLLEPFILLVAANRAIHQSAHNRMYTRSLSAELIYSLSPTKNISESLITFGIAADSRNLIVATFADTKGKQLSKIAKNIDGTLVHMEDLKSLIDLSAIKKIYKVPDHIQNSGQMSDYIVTRIISKDIVS